MTPTASTPVSDIDATIPRRSMRNEPAIDPRPEPAERRTCAIEWSSPKEIIAMPLPSAVANEEGRFGNVWNVANYKSLPRIPPLYVLERTRASIRTASPTDLAARIVTCLRDLSLDASYDDESATALVVGADQVELFVRFFQDNNNGTGSIVVEIQKKSGCAFRFHRRARSILRAAAGVVAAAGVAADGSSGRVRMCKRVPRPALIQRREHAKSTTTSCVETNDAEKEIDLALEIVDGLVKKDRIDANVLGMESLVLLTDEETTSFDKAMYAARAILRGDRFEDVKAKTMTLLEPTETEDDELDYSSELQHGDALRLHALTVLANSLSLVARNEDELCSIASTEEWVGENGLLSTLIGELNRAESAPHCAYQAARALNALARASVATRRRAVELGAPAVVSRSQNVGHCRHALLAHESDLFMTTLGESK